MRLKLWKVGGEWPEKECARNGSGEVEDVEHGTAWKTLSELLLAQMQKLQEGGHDNLAAFLLSYTCRNVKVLSMILICGGQGLTNTLYKHDTF